MMPTNCSVLRTLTILPDMSISWDYHHIFPARKILATVPANVASNAPGSVKRVFVTFAARKYTLMV